MLKNLLNVKKLLKPKKPMDFLKLALVIVLGYILVKLLLKKMNNRETFLNQGEKAFVFVHMDGCGHCDTLMPEWKKAVQSNTSNIKMMDFEKSTPEGKKLVTEHNIEGFPAVMLLESKTVKKDYNGERTEAGLLAFLEANK